MRKIIFIFLFLILTAGIFSFFMSSAFESEISYDSNLRDIGQPSKPVVIHIKTPEPLKAAYMSSCYASMPNLRSKLVKLIDETELNAIVIDIKDYTGTVSFNTNNPNIDSISDMPESKGCKVKDMEDFVRSLHDKNIYVIGRVTVFQDPLYTKAFPNMAVKKKSDGSVWRDRKGLAFIDVGAKSFWDYIISIATSSHSIGFDEINLDYVRFPSDGDMKDIHFPHTGTVAKKEMLRQFFEYTGDKLRSEGIPTSVDLFGMTTTNTDDLNIGQVLEYALMHFDYVAPMVYPSHYPPMFNGWKDPNKVPYEIIKYSMDSAVARTNSLYLEISSSSPNSHMANRIKPLQLRTWIQDFDYPVPYTADMVRKQIQATYDSGLSSWMLWDPSNTYTREALLLDTH